MAVAAPSTIDDVFGRPLRDLRISVTDRCNFRCPYCMPAEIYGERYQFLPKDQILSFEEIARLAGIFASLGVVKLRLTGGEPTIRAELPTLIEMLSGIEGVEDLTLTTNGYLLARMADALKKAGLQRITVSLDSLDEETFKKMNGRNFGTRPVLDGIAAAEKAGLSPIKINCVVQRGVNDHTIPDLAAHFRGTGHIVRFIEFMDVGTLNRWDMKQVVTAEEIVARIGSVFPLEAVTPAYRGETALRYRYADGKGEIGVIASVSKPFCGDCTRARLSTDGRLVTCLFAAGGKDLRAPLRTGASDDELRSIIRGVWSKRRDRYSEERAGISGSGTGKRGRRKIEMYQIGG
ncbi:MAG: GTP 3',8-cyclase MoaA [SAR202 cluster bacterium]|nr:GTP 3',8-cyclase MoaA [SAR202 cluster bacterium]